MNYIENLEALKKSLNMKENRNGAKHTINVKAPFLPFPTRGEGRAKFGKKFNGVSGEVARILSENKLLREVETDQCIDNIISIVDCKEEEDRKYLREIVKNYFLNKDEDINVFHPHLFQYIELTEGKESKGEESIAQFICDVILEHDEKFKNVFMKNDTNHIITKLILSKLDNLEKREKKSVYKNNLKYVSSVAIEDFEFMINNEEFFLKNFQSLLAYYYFYYITQLVVKLNKRSKADYEKIEDIYYLLDWEKVSKNRKSVTKGYKFIKAENRNTLININIIEHLNFIFGVEGYNFSEIYELFKSMLNKEQKEVLLALKAWIEYYKNFFNQDSEELNLDYDELVKALNDSFWDKIGKDATVTRYASTVEEIGKKYFLKVRGGTYGYMLNITQEMLLLITAVSIKNKKITLKELFKEYERRGLFFDQYSKNLIVELLGRLNLIDKKSDSGDAQYVKGIL